MWDICELGIFITHNHQYLRIVKRASRVVAQKNVCKKIISDFRLHSQSAENECVQRCQTSR